MISQGWLQIGLTLLIGFVISIPVGRYLAIVVTERNTSAKAMALSQRQISESASQGYRAA